MVESLLPRERTDTARLLIIDDEPEFLELLEAWFARQDYALATAGDGYAALALMRQRTFDVVVTDLKMPGLSGLDVLQLVKDLDPAVEVIILTGQGTMQDAIVALREGRAFDFLQKPLHNLGDLKTAIDRAHARRRARVAPLPRPANVAALSGREVEIVAGLARGLDNRAIAEGLAVSEKTIKNHLTRIYEKLAVKNRTQAVLLCQQLGLI